MSHVAIAATKDRFLRGGRPYFYLADTVWLTFSVLQEHDWREYLEYRWQQGFNTVQITVLPIFTDKGDNDLGIIPFHAYEDGRWDFSRINEAYFQRATRMVEIAVSYGFTCALAPLWLGYVINTAVSRRFPEYIMPFERIDSYIEYIVQTFDRFNPIYIAGGDTDFRTPETIASYLEELRALKYYAPQTLTTFHPGSNSDLPDEIAASPDLDFYMYQSGHILTEQDKVYEQAMRYTQRQPQRPVVNGEPCYEGHGFGFQYGRFGAFHVRGAFWQSVLSGAKAGFTYGAHGIWSWHQRDVTFNNEAWSQTPFDWHTALRFRGAEDVAYAKELFEAHNLFDLEPANDLLVASPTPTIRLAATVGREKVALYIPYATKLTVKLDLSDYQVVTFDLETRNVRRVRLQVTKDGSTFIPMMEHNADTLLIATRE